MEGETGFSTKVSIFKVIRANTEYEDSKSYIFSSIGQAVLRKLVFNKHRNSIVPHSFCARNEFSLLLILLALLASVSLRGHVRSWPQKREARNAAQVATDDNLHKNENGQIFSSSLTFKHSR